MKFFQKKAQTAIEYLLLLALVAVVVIISFSNLLPRVKDSSGQYFVKATESIMGQNARRVNGGWCDWGEPALVQGSVTQCMQNRLCDCPPPFGTGDICAGSNNRIATGCH